MILINIINGFIMAVCMTAARTWVEGAYLNDWFFWAVWAGWTLAHIIQDILDYQTVKWFNKDKIVTRDMLR